MGSVCVFSFILLYCTILADKHLPPLTAPAHKMSVIPAYAEMTDFGQTCPQTASEYRLNDLEALLYSSWTIAQTEWTDNFHNGVNRADLRRRQTLQHNSPRENVCNQENDNDSHTGVNL